jgi:hypothetical protein
MPSTSDNTERDLAMEFEWKRWKRDLAMEFTHFPTIRKFIHLIQQYRSNQVIASPEANKGSALAASRLGRRQLNSSSP